MCADKHITIVQMKSGQSGKIVEVNAGHGLTRRLEVFGLRPGKRIKKVSSMFRHGPVTIQVGGSQLALGYGMAQKVLVEVPDE